MFICTFASQFLPVSVFLSPVSVFIGFSIILVAIVCVFTGVISVLCLLFCTWIYVFLYAFTFVLYLQ